MCLKGTSGAGAELLAAMPHADLRAYYVWVPMLPTDKEAAALSASERFTEPRATHYWDAERHLSHQMARALAIDTRRKRRPRRRPALRLGRLPRLPSRKS